MSLGECSNDMKSLRQSNASWGSVGAMKELHRNPAALDDYVVCLLPQM